MNTLFAANLFDGPWLLALIVIVSALANWLSKRRQEKEADEHTETEPPPLPNQPKGEFDLEEAMRRLLGEETPPRQPVPPPIIPRTAPDRPPAEADWQDAEDFQPEPAWREEVQERRAEARETTVQLPPLIRSTPVVPARADVPIRSPGVEQARAAHRLATLTEAGARPATVVHGGARRLRAGARAAYWRNPRNAREAFVASLVFGPPKGLET